MSRRGAVIVQMEFMAENIPQPGMGLVEAFLAVDFKDVARPAHRHRDNVADLTRPVRHHDDAVGQRHGLDEGRG